jgi:hypothetical protein
LLLLLLLLLLFPLLLLHVLLLRCLQGCRGRQWARLWLKLCPLLSPLSKAPPSALLPRAATREGCCLTPLLGRLVFLCPPACAVLCSWGCNARGTLSTAVVCGRRM